MLIELKKMNDEKLEELFSEDGIVNGKSRMSFHPKELSWMPFTQGDYGILKSYAHYSLD